MTSRYTLSFLILTILYLHYLNTNFLAPKNEIVLAPISFATEAETPVSTPSATKVAPTRVEVPVLTYHYIQEATSSSELTQSLSVSPNNLEEQLKYVVENSFTTISPEELHKSVVYSSPLPDRSVLLTFDDGYKDFYQNAYPLLKKYGLKATTFISVGLLDRFQYMSSQEVRQLAADPLITIGSHTLHHPDLTLISVESAWDEISNGKKKLEEMTGREVTSFAYPYGAFNNRVLGQVSEAGFKIAFTTQRGRSHSWEKLLVLPRLTIEGRGTLTEFGQNLSTFKNSREEVNGDNPQ